MTHSHRPPGTAPARSWHRYVEPGLVLVIALLGAMLCHASGLAEPLGDELGIVRPAIEHMRGVFSTDVKYPSFIYWLYGLFFWLSGTLDDNQASMSVARIVNAALFAGYVWLSYATLRRLIARQWQLLATLVMATAPIITTNAFLVKTENLLLVELLVMIYALLRIEEEPGVTRWHLLAAAAAALSVTTKLSFYAGLLYALQWLRLWRSGRAPSWRMFMGSALAFVAVTLASWTNLWVFDEVIQGWASDPYFQPNASPLRAVDELLAFPYGRYSSFFSVTLPLALGWPLIGLWLASYIKRTQGSWMLGVLGLGTLIYLIVSLHGTLLRVPFSFMVLFIYPLLAVFSMLPQKPSPRQTQVWAALQLVCIGYGLWVMTQIDRRGSFERDLMQMVQQHSGGGRMAFYVIPDATQVEKTSIRSHVERQQPAAMAVFSSYFHNMCKYRDHPLYGDNCSFYQELLSGRAGYEIADQLPYIIPGGALHIDREVRDARFYVLRKQQEP